MPKKSRRHIGRCRDIGIKTGGRCRASSIWFEGSHTILLDDNGLYHIREARLRWPFVENTLDRDERRLLEIQRPWRIHRCCIS